MKKVVAKDEQKEKIKKVVLAYSGGLDTSVLVKLLQDKYNLEVITFTGDLGQETDFEKISEKAKKLGVKKSYCIDLKKEFVENYIFPALKANALYEGSYPLSTAIGRPLLAKNLVEIAEKENASAVAHGCTGKGNDQVRFEVTINALNPNLKVIAPIREWNLTRTQAIEYAKKNGIEIPEKIGKYSIDQNLWGRSVECGPLENPENEPLDEVFEWTVPLEKAPDKPEYVKIGFENGIPTAINGEKVEPVELIQKLNEIGGGHGVGKIDHIESRLVGIKSHEIYECPAAIILITAHRDLEKLVLTKHVLQFKSLVEQKWAELAYTGLWIDPLKNALDNFIDYTQKFVDGEVTVKLYKGSCLVVGRKSENSIYSYDLATYEEHGKFEQKDAEPFIKLWGLQSVLFNLKNKK